MFFSIIDNLTSHIIADDVCDLVRGKQFLGVTQIRTVEEHQHHTGKQSGVVLHGISDIFQFFFRQYLNLCLVTQYLYKAHDDIQWRTYLMGDILYEGSLLTVGFLCQLSCLSQFLVMQFGLFSRIAHAPHMEIQRLQHYGEAILQAAHHILTLSGWDMYLHITCSNALCLLQ